MPRKEALIRLAAETVKVLRKIEQKASATQSVNASNGRMEFAYVRYYLPEACNLLDLSVFLLTHEAYRKYVYFPARQMMEIVLYLEDVYQLKKEKGTNEVRRLLFKDMAKAVKSMLELPGEKGKETLKKQLMGLNIASKILNLDFNTDSVSPKFKRDVKRLCKKSKTVLKNTTGVGLYDFYSVLSESLHANVVNVGESNHEKDDTEALMIFEISIELAIRLSEMIVSESNYIEITPDVETLKRVAWGPQPLENS